jgi:uncharacterized protein YlxP (DUF503 family)
MVVGILQFDLHVHGAESLKDKRRVVSSVKDRLHREHQVSVAEVALQEVLNVARLGLALVGTDGAHVGVVLDQILAKLRALHDAELGDTTREILHGQQLGAEPDPGPGDIDAEMLRRASEQIPEQQ